MPDILGFAFYDNKGITHFVEGKPGLGMRPVSLCGIPAGRLTQAGMDPLPLSGLSDKENICRECLGFLGR